MTATAVAIPTLRDLNDLNRLAGAINANARAHGFWEADRDLGEMLMLAVSELAEALEAHREGQPARWLAHSKDCSILPGAPRRNGCRDGCIGKPEGTAVELADCIIRCLDTLYSMPGADVNDEVDAAIERIEKYGKPLPENFAAALLAVTRDLTKAEHAIALDRPSYLAEAIVRCDELIRRLGRAPDTVVTEKMAYNASRPYKHGKAY